MGRPPSLSPTKLQEIYQEYLEGELSISKLATKHHIATSTLKAYAKKGQWRKRKKRAEERYVKQATTERLLISNQISGMAIDIIKRHAVQTHALSRGLKVKNLIPKDIVDEAYRLMNTFDKTYPLIYKTRESSTPDQIHVVADHIRWEEIAERKEAGFEEGRKQLLEWEASMNPEIKEKQKEATDVFDAQSQDEPEDEVIEFAGADQTNFDDSDDDSPIGGLFD